MRVGFFEVEDWEEPIIRERLKGHEIVVSKGRIAKEELPQDHDFEIISGFVDSPITKDVLSEFPNLKFVTTRSTGYDHIDIAACKERGVLAGYVPGYGDNTVAEFAFGLLLNLMRKVYQGIDQIKESSSFSQANLRGRDLKGKTIGIVGTGRIGRESVRIAQGFGMKVIAYDPYPNQEYAAQVGLQYVSFEDLLRNADIISFHCPLTPETKHLINKSNVGIIKKGAYLVNTARGAIVETAALVEGLEQGILAGVAIDVLEEEGDTKDELSLLRNPHPNAEELKTVLENHYLIHSPNVLMTPHIAFNSEEAMRRILDITLDNIASFAEGKPVNLIPGQQ